MLSVHVVRRGRRDGSAAHIRDDTLGVLAGRHPRMVTPPVFVKGSREYNPCPDPAQQEIFVRHVGGANFVVMPLFARAFTGKTSQLRHQCTGKDKIEPIIRKARELVGRRTRAPPRSSKMTCGPGVVTLGCSIVTTNSPRAGVPHRR